ncbi:hypothetical protein SAMN06298214_1434 [Bacteroidales bacterium WCE2004]|jgi:hypothetical protein|nr:hypothetical protein SAMN06298214_1434 [Bacteroidales bacterium WCE2004]
MKTLEEIERLSLEELEQEATRAAAPVPDGLQERLRQTLAARELADAARPRPTRWIPYASLAVAAAAAAVIALPQRGPKDTFDDPRLAYAEVEKVFRTISDKMNEGVALVREAEAAAEIPQNILNKTQK